MISRPYFFRISPSEICIGYSDSDQLKEFHKFGCEAAEILERLDRAPDAEATTLILEHVIRERAEGWHETHA